MNLTENDFQTGFLIDHNWLAGIQKTNLTKNDNNSIKSNTFTAFLIDLLEGAPIAAHEFTSFELALAALYNLKRNWKFETFHSKCKKGTCTTCTSKKCHNSNFLKDKTCCDVTSMSTLASHGLGSNSLS